ncbi:hypothetical protein, partial [Shimia marina]|uniref:hypothetical protein n=1 Tax=Shimia marina TaxID=321267 RepID=UPI001F31E34D
GVLRLSRRTRKRFFKQKSPFFKKSQKYNNISNLHTPQPPRHPARPKKPNQNTKTHQQTHPTPKRLTQIKTKVPNKQRNTKLQRRYHSSIPTVSQQWNNQPKHTTELTKTKHATQGRGRKGRIKKAAFAPSQNKDGLST